MTKDTVIGIFDNFIPEEIFHAAGLTTVRLCHALKQGKGGVSFFPSRSCLFCTHLDKQAGELSRLDGIVLSATCTAAEKLYEALLKKLPSHFITILDVPKGVHSGSVRFFAGRLKKLAFELSRHFQCPLPDDRLFQTIDLNNRLRESLRGKNQCRSLVEQAERLSLENLGKVIEKIGRMQEAKTKKPCILVTGSHLKEDMIRDYIEKQGGSVQCFLTEDGYYYNHINVEILSGDPYYCLAMAYLEKNVQQRRIYCQPDIDRIKDIIQDKKITGIITFHYPFCVKTGYDISWITANSGKLGIPVLNVQAEDTVSLPAGIQGRVAAFIEMLGERSM